MHYYLNLIHYFSIFRIYREKEWQTVVLAAYQIKLASYLALLKTSADIGLLPESSASTMEDIKIDKMIPQISRIGTIITTQENEERFREHLHKR